MLSNWKQVHLGEVAQEVTVGFVGSMASEYVTSGVPFLRSLNVQPHRITSQDIRYVSPDFHRRIAKSALAPGDVVTVRTGKPGATAVIPEWLSAANCSDLVVTRPGRDLDARWLSYYINGVADSYVSSRLVGAVQQHFNVGAAKELVLNLPPLEEQRGIAATLGALDEKVDSNHHLLASVVALMSARVQRAIDEDSVAIPVSDLARFVNGGAYTKGASGTGRMVIRIKELNSGPGASTVYNDIEVPEEKTARAGDILMSWSGSLGVYRWSLDEAIINQHIFKVLPSRYPDWLVFDRLTSVLAEFRAIAQDKATTMGHIQRGHLEATQVQVPTVGDIKSLDKALGPLWDRIKLAEQENRKLAALRDTLLPELLSGRLRVPEAAAAIASV